MCLVCRKRPYYQIFLNQSGIIFNRNMPPSFCIKNPKENIFFYFFKQNLPPSFCTKNPKKIFSFSLKKKQNHGVNSARSAENFWHVYQQCEVQDPENRLNEKKSVVILARSAANFSRLICAVILKIVSPPLYFSAKKYWEIIHTPFMGGFKRYSLVFCCM